jgi:hypothetical protein
MVHTIGLIVSREAEKGCFLCIMIAGFISGSLLALAVSITLLAIGMLVRFLVTEPAGNRHHKKKQHVLKYGTEATAVLLSIQPTGLYFRQEQEVVLQVQVQPVKGRNFVAEIRDCFSYTELHGLRIGHRLTVKYHSAQPRQVVLVHKTFYGRAEKPQDV